MVLASNEWQNFCNGDEKSADNDTTNADTATTNTTTTTSAIASTTTTTTVTATAATANININNNNNSTSAIIAPATITAPTNTAAATTTTTNITVSAESAKPKIHSTEGSATEEVPSKSEVATETTTTTTTTRTITSTSISQQPIAISAKSSDPPPLGVGAQSAVKLVATIEGTKEYGGGREGLNDSCGTKSSEDYEAFIQQQQHQIQEKQQKQQELQRLLLLTYPQQLQYQQQHQQNQKPPPPTYEEVLLLNTNNLKMMADNTNELIKSEAREARAAAAADNNTDQGTVIKTENNNHVKRELHDEEGESDEHQPQQHRKSPPNEEFRDLITEFCSELIKTHNNSNSNEDTMCNSISNSNSNSISNSKTNTLQSAPTTINSRGENSGKAIATVIGQPQLSCPVTPQALNNALQSVFADSTTTVNDTNTNDDAMTSRTTTSNSFLDAIGVGSSPPLPSNAKQMICLPTVDSLDLPSLSSDPQYVPPPPSSGLARIVLLCEQNSHPFQTRTIQLPPNMECKVGRLIAKSKANESNAIFDCKVLSRNHAVLWYSNDDCKFYVKDTKSSNGTFINDYKLGAEPSELHFGDIVKFGVDVLENARKEVHGCIIACVKLYLPDGREAISIDASQAQTTRSSAFSAEGRISFDEIHRLNLYMQESSQREKVLKSKLYNIQNVLDASRKNSALCWQSMIAEDQLLHRIHTLEKKLQFMEKNAPENVLRNEVMKLLDEKNSYQHAAKEALRKVYQERCDALQLLTKMETAYNTSDAECKILREQVLNTKQSMQDINTRLLRLECEYNDYRAETERQQLEANEQEEERLAGLAAKLREYESECNDLRRRLAEWLNRPEHNIENIFSPADNSVLKTQQKRSKESTKGNENLSGDDDDDILQQQQAIEKLDAAIADMDLGDDDDDEDDDVDEEETEDVDNDGADEEQQNGQSLKKKTKENKSIKKQEQKEQRKALELLAFARLAPEARSPKFTKHKVVKEATILKWLQNSDLNQNEASMDIFKAICNDASDSSEEQETATINKNNAKNASAGCGEQTVDSDSLQRKCSKFTSKLQTVQENLHKLEAEIASETNKAADLIAKLDDGSAAVGSSDSDEDDDDEQLRRHRRTTIVPQQQEISEMSDESNEENKSNREQKSAEAHQRNSALSKDNNSYLLLKHSVSMLREAYNEICSNMQNENNAGNNVIADQIENLPSLEVVEEIYPSPAVSVHTQLKSGGNGSTNPKHRSLETQETLRRITFKDEADDNSDTSLASTSLTTITPSKSSIDATPLEDRLQKYERMVDELHLQLQSKEQESQNTLEMLQIESESYQAKARDLNRELEKMRKEHKSLEERIRYSNEGTGLADIDCSSSDSSYLRRSAASHAGNISFESLLNEEAAALCDESEQREEELILYKEQLEWQQQDNAQLRNEMINLKSKMHEHRREIFGQILPYGFATLALFVYILYSYM